MITKEEFEKEWNGTKGSIRIIVLGVENEGTVKVTKTMNTINADEYKIEHSYVRLFYEGTNIGVVSLSDVNKVLPGKDKRNFETKCVDDIMFTSALKLQIAKDSLSSMTIDDLLLLRNEVTVEIIDKIMSGYESRITEGEHNE